MNHRKKPDVSRFDDRLASVYAGEQDKEKHYDNWAKDYETDLVNDLGYVAHHDACEIFTRHVPGRACRVLDVACGTGLVGERLRELGYMDVDGVDFSREMLKLSDERNVYGRLWRQDFTRPADPPVDYDHLVCVGLFSYSVPAISDMHNVVNCIRPGGRAVITVNGAAWRDLDLGALVDAEIAEHGYTLVAVEQAGYIESQGIDSRVLVIER